MVNHIRIRAVLRTDVGRQIVLPHQGVQIGPLNADFVGRASNVSIATLQDIY